MAGLPQFPHEAADGNIDAVIEIVDNRDNLRLRKKRRGNILLQIHITGVIKTSINRIV